MRLDKVFDQAENNFEGDVKKRYACSHCGKTWVEVVGLFASRIDDQDDLYFRLGMESETCQNCKFRIRSCPECGSKDVYEINFSTANAKDSPLSFDRIRIVSKI